MVSSTLQPRDRVIYASSTITRFLIHLDLLSAGG